VIAHPCLPAFPLQQSKRNGQAVLDKVARVQASWGAIQAGCAEHAIHLMRTFFGIAPKAMALFSFAQQPGGAPSVEVMMADRCAE
jgi:hypothetical protein